MWIILTKKIEGTQVLVNANHIYRIEQEKEGSMVYFPSATARVRETPYEIMEAIRSTKHYEADDFADCFWHEKHYCESKFSEEL